MSDDYEVGYGKPPLNGRFKRGQSGNPRGRPKKSRNFKTDLKDELSETVRVNEGGAVQTVSKQRAILKRAMEKALKGDMRAAALIVGWMAAYLDFEDGAEAGKSLGPDDRAIIERFVAARNGGCRRPKKSGCSKANANACYARCTTD